MRARYVAYAGNLADFIINTTDPAGPMWQLDKAEWRSEITSFAALTQFEGVLIIAVRPDGDHTRVHFRAQLNQQGRDASFEEDSLFTRYEGRWFYHSGRH